MSEETVQVYLRTSQKVGKLLTLPPRVTHQHLYQAAAEAQELLPSQLHLYIQGKLLLPDDSLVTLKEKAIVHLVKLEEASKQELEVSVRMLEGRTHPNTIDVNSQSTLRDFIDHQLYKVYGEKSDKLVLIHLGRQLPLDRTFHQEDIEDGAELICVNLEELRQKKLKANKKEEDEDRELYPAPHFPIEVPQEVNATSNMELLFDPTIHQSSSIPDYSIPPEEVIPEEETNLVSATSDHQQPQLQLQDNNVPSEDKEDGPVSDKPQPDFSLKESAPLQATDEKIVQNLFSTPAEPRLEQLTPQEEETAKSPAQVASEDITTGEEKPKEKEEEGGAGEGEAGEADRDLDEELI